MTDTQGQEVYGEAAEYPDDPPEKAQAFYGDPPTEQPENESEATP